MIRPHRPQRSRPCSSAGPSRAAPPPCPRGGRQFAAQPCGVGLVGLPGDEPGMVVGDQHRPLLARQQPVPGDARVPAGVDALLGAGAAEHERPGIGRVGQEVVHRRVGRPAPR